MRKQNKPNFKVKHPFRHLIRGLIIGIIMLASSIFSIGYSVWARASSDTSSYVLVNELFDSRTRTFDSDNFNILLKYLSGNSSATISTVTSLVPSNFMSHSVYSATSIRSNSVSSGTQGKVSYSSKSTSQDVNVMLGGLEWTVTCLSKDTSGNTILTLWLSDYKQSAWSSRSSTEGARYGYLNGGLYSSFNSYSNYYMNKNYPSNMYATSYISVVTLNNGGTYGTSTTGGTTFTSSSSSAFALFTMPTYGLTDYIVTPASVAWQESQSAYTDTDDAFDYSAPNDAWGENIDHYPDGYSFTDGTSYRFLYNSTYGGYNNYSYGGNGNSNERNSAWNNDYIWLPSITEVTIPGSGVTRGIWKLSTNQIACGGNTASTTSIGTVSSSSLAAYDLIMFRSGENVESSKAGSNFVAYTSDGSTGYTTGSTALVAGIRPALHLNLTKIASSLTYVQVGELFDKDSSDGSQFNIDNLNILFRYMTGNSSVDYTNIMNLVSPYGSASDDFGKQAGYLYYGDYGYYSYNARSMNAKTLSAGSVNGTYYTSKSSGQSITVRLGGLDWTVTCLSNNKNGDVLLTLWLDNNYQEAWVGYGNGPHTGTYMTSDGGYYSKWQLFSDGDSYRSALYGYSYMATVGLNNYGSYYTNSSGSTSYYSAKSSHPFANFTYSTYGLTSYLATPSTVPWQEYQSAYYFWGPGETNTPYNYSCYNDAWGKTYYDEDVGVADSDWFYEEGYYGDYYVFGQHTNYTGHAHETLVSSYRSYWNNDYLWLPSVAEVGNMLGDVKYNGLWGVSNSQRMTAGGQEAIDNTSAPDDDTATGYNSSGTAGTVYKRTYLRSAKSWDYDWIVCLDGTGYSDYAFNPNGNVGVRPALHLNLSKVFKPEVPTTYGPDDNDSSTFYGEQVVGSGSSSDPYRIDDWGKFVFLNNYWNKVYGSWDSESHYYVLTQDVSIDYDYTIIDASNGEYTGYSIRYYDYLPTLGWVDSGFVSSTGLSFSGYLYGNGHTITVEYNSDNRGIGTLFSRFGEGAELYNFTYDIGGALESYSSQTFYGGILVNNIVDNDWNTRIEYVNLISSNDSAVYVSGNLLNGARYAGLLVGAIDSDCYYPCVTIQQCLVDIPNVTFNVSYSTEGICYGGILGMYWDDGNYNSSSIYIRDCAVTSNITIKNTYSGNISSLGYNNYVAGIVGYFCSDYDITVDRVNANVTFTLSGYSFNSTYKRLRVGSINGNLWNYDTQINYGATNFSVNPYPGEFYTFITNSSQSSSSYCWYGYSCGVYCDSCVGQVYFAGVSGSSYVTVYDYEIGTVSYTPISLKPSSDYNGTQNDDPNFSYKNGWYTKLINGEYYLYHQVTKHVNYRSWDSSNTTTPSSTTDGDWTVYTVDTPEKLNYFSGQKDSRYGEYCRINITADLDMSQYVWCGIDTTDFYAFEIYGNGHTISGLYTNMMLSAYELLGFYVFTDSCLSVDPCIYSLRFQDTYVVMDSSNATVPIYWRYSTSDWRTYSYGIKYGSLFGSGTSTVKYVDIDGLYYKHWTTSSSYTIPVLGQYMHGQYFYGCTMNNVDSNGYLQMFEYMDTAVNMYYTVIGGGCDIPYFCSNSSAYTSYIEPGDLNAYGMFDYSGKFLSDMSNGLDIDRVLLTKGTGISTYDIIDYWIPAPEIGVYMDYIDSGYIDVDEGLALESSSWMMATTDYHSGTEMYIVMYPCERNAIKYKIVNSVNGITDLDTLGIHPEFWDETSQQFYQMSTGYSDVHVLLGTLSTGGTLYTYEDIHEYVNFYSANNNSSYYVTFSVTDNTNTQTIDPAEDIDYYPASGNAFNYGNVGKGRGVEYVEIAVNYTYYNYYFLIANVKNQAISRDSDGNPLYTVTNATLVARDVDASSVGGYSSDYTYDLWRCSTANRANVTITYNEIMPYGSVYQAVTTDLSGYEYVRTHMNTLINTSPGAMSNAHSYVDNGAIFNQTMTASSKTITFNNLALHIDNTFDDKYLTTTAQSTILADQDLNRIQLTHAGTDYLITYEQQDDRGYTYMDVLLTRFTSATSKYASFESDNLLDDDITIKYYYSSYFQGHISTGTGAPSSPVADGFFNTGFTTEGYGDTPYLYTECSNSTLPGNKLNQLYTAHADGGICTYGYEISSEGALAIDTIYGSTPLTNIYLYLTFERIDYSDKVNFQISYDDYGDGTPTISMDAYYYKFNTMTINFPSTNTNIYYFHLDYSELGYTDYYRKGDTSNYFIPNDTTSPYYGSAPTSTSCKMRSSTTMTIHLNNAASYTSQKTVYAYFKALTWSDIAKVKGTTLSGSGTDASPYTISSALDWGAFVNTYSSNKVYSITNDIDFSKIKYSSTDYTRNYFMPDMTSQSWSLFEGTINGGNNKFVNCRFIYI